MMKLICLGLFAVAFVANANAQTQNVSAEESQNQLIQAAEKIEIEPIRRAALSQNGRIKPFDTMARETILFLNGSYKRLGVHPVQLYLAIASSPSAPYAPFIEVRDPELRVRLGYTKSKRFFSLADLESSEIINLVRPLFKKQEEGGKLNENERKVTDVYGQVAVTQQIIMGTHFTESIDFRRINGGDEKAGVDLIANQAKAFLAALKSPGSANLKSMAADLVSASQKQKVPELFLHYLEKIDAEIVYNDFRFFLWSYFLAISVGLMFVTGFARQKLSEKRARLLHLAPIIPLIIGLSLRVYVTQFAPVTNMYGTMIWVSFGVFFFSMILFSLYKNWTVSGSLMIGAGLILLLTEQIPLVLSPDLDPIVAVLRSNFWLSTHVTTITISYAAFSIAMILGNIALVRLFTHKENEKFFKEFSHYTYRMIQLGCFLLTVGIILGGVWADYSWGRFWGWDPKETWALIADLGFLALLHARYIGWVNDFKLLALSPVAYLMVVMAWYGVNFILAAGLHSYGFSSGGATAVAVFVSLQLGLLFAGLLKYRSILPAGKSVTK